MGYSMSWVAVRGKSYESACEEAGLVGTGVREDIPEAPLLGRKLANGWSLLLANDNEFLRFAVNEALFQRLSRGGESVACYVEEHENKSGARGCRYGRMAWSVDFDGSDGLPGRLDVRGDISSEFGSIRQRLEEKQRHDVRGNVAYLFDAPVELAKAITGFRYDEDMPDAEDRTFEVLSERPRTSLWRKIFGC